MVIDTLKLINHRLILTGNETFNSRIAPTNKRFINIFRYGYR